MAFRIEFSHQARSTLVALESNASQAARYRKVLKTLGLLELNPRHPGLNTHRYQSKRGPAGEAMWESYVENRAPSAWRIWFMYGPGTETITIISIGPHPD